MSESNDQVDEDIEQLASERPDIRFTVDNGKHLEIDIDPIEWVVLLTGIVLIIGLLGRFGLF